MTELAQGDVALLATDTAQDLLAANLPARLAFTAADGTPRVVPINFVWNGDELVMSGFAPSRKARAIRSHPDVAVTIDTNEAPPQVLLLRGRADVTESDGLLPEYAQAMRKGGDEPVAEYLAAVAERAPRMERIALRPSWVGVLDFETRFPGGAPAWMRGEEEGES